MTQEQVQSQVIVPPEAQAGKEARYLPPKKDDFLIMRNRVPTPGSSGDELFTAAAKWIQLARRDVLNLLRGGPATETTAFTSRGGYKPRNPAIRLGPAKGRIKLPPKVSFCHLTWEMSMSAHLRKQRVICICVRPACPSGSRYLPDDNSIWTSKVSTQGVSQRFQSWSLQVKAPHAGPTVNMSNWYEIRESIQKHHQGPNVSLWVRIDPH